MLFRIDCANDVSGVLIEVEMPSGKFVLPGIEVPRPAARGTCRWRAGGVPIGCSVWDSWKCQLGINFNVIGKLQKEI